MSSAHVFINANMLAPMYFINANTDFLLKMIIMITMKIFVLTSRTDWLWRTLRSFNCKSGFAI